MSQDLCLLVMILTLIVKLLTLLQKIEAKQQNRAHLCMCLSAYTQPGRVKMKTNGARRKKSKTLSSNII